MSDGVKNIAGVAVAVSLATISLSAIASWEHGGPVTTYWFGPGCPGTNSVAMTEAWAAQLKEGGFNTVWASRPEDLDIAAKYGLRAIYCIDPGTEWAKIDLDDPAQKDALAERINRVKNHPALYIYEHYDEASAQQFPELARVREFVNRLDPKHAMWHNLLPTYASHRQLGVGGKTGEEPLMGFPGDKIASYWEHLRLFCDVYQPEFITYDHYQFKVNGDSRKYFLNLGLVRQAAAARRVPFWNGLQACTWVPCGLASPKAPRIPNTDEMRYLAHTTAAYGANGLYWYVYCRPRHDGSIAALDGTVGEKYEGVKKINREFIAFSKVLGGLDFKGAFMQGVHATGTTPYGAQALLKITPETPYSEIRELQRLEDTTLVTRFEDRRCADAPRTYLMVVNCDYRKDRTLHVEAPFAAELFNPATEAWTPVGASFDLALVRGGGAILRESSAATGWNPSVKARLDALVERNRGNPGAYAVFDFDYTTAIGDLTYLCMWRAMETMDFKTDDFAAQMSEGVPAAFHAEIGELGRSVAKLKPLAATGANLAELPEWRDFAKRFWSLYRRLFDVMGESDIVMWRIRLFKGYTPDEMRRLAKEAISAAQKRGGLWRDGTVPSEKRGLAIVPEMKELFRSLREAGIAVYIVSASVKETLLEATGPDFGLEVDPENVFGTALKLDAEGRYLPEKADGCVKSGRKHEFIMERIAPRHGGAEPVLTAGDSMGDYTMLTGFKNLQLALVFVRNWREKEMADLAASGGVVAAQGRDETRGVLIPEPVCVTP